MDITNKRDIRLVGRAIREGWPVTQEVKEKVVAALLDVIAARDPKLMVEAIDRLLKADKLNVDREALAQRNQAADEDRRLQLLEIARRIPAGELVKLASESGIVIDAEPVDDGSGSGQSTQST